MKVSNPQLNALFLTRKKKYLLTSTEVVFAAIALAKEQPVERVEREEEAVHLLCAQRLEL